MNEARNLPQIPADFFSPNSSLAPRENERRRFARHEFRAAAPTRLHGNLAAFPRNSEAVWVFLADFSRSGVRFLCDRQLFPSEIIEIDFPQIGPRRCLIRRCLRIQKNCYEIGAELCQR